jgi:hypothetical protein
MIFCVLMTSSNLFDCTTGKSAGIATLEDENDIKANLMDPQC